MMAQKDACKNLVRFPRYRTYLLETEKCLFQVGCVCGQKEADRRNGPFALSSSLVDGHFVLDDPFASDHVLGITKRILKLNLIDSL
jgi:hypothetical protein